MADQLSLRGGTTAEHATFTGANKEVTVDTTKKTLVVNDGATVGGHPLMRENASNSALALGSAGTPSLKFTGDTNTGIYSPGADQLAVATNGVGRLFVDASGNLLVGTYANSGGLGERLSINGAGLVTQSAAATNRGIFGTFGGSTQIIGAFDNIPLEFRTNNTERLRITSAGLVGIGVSAPQATLHANGAILSSGTLVALSASNIFFDQPTSALSRIGVVGANTSTAGALRISQYSSDGSVGRDVFSIDDQGLVGIGTASPLHRLDISGASARLNNGTNASTDLYFGPVSAAGNYSYINWNNTAGSELLTLYTDGGGIRFSPAGSERARLDTSGRLLVGTTSSSANTRLVIQGNTAGGTYQAGVVDVRINGANPPANYTIGEINFRDNADARGALIKSESDGDWASDDYPGRLVFSTTADGASSPTERMRLDKDGRSYLYSSTGGLASVVNVGATTTDNVFVCGHSATSTTTGVASLFVRSNGNVLNTNNSYGAISDVKLKENIVDANSQWNDLKALQVRNYNFKEGQTHTQIGLVAQEVELVSPGLVSESPDRDADGNDLGTVTKSVNYSVLYMKAVKALQEAMERIETLEQRLNDAGIN